MSRPSSDEQTHYTSRHYSASYSKPPGVTNLQPRISHLLLPPRVSTPRKWSRTGARGRKLRSLVTPRDDNRTPYIPCRTKPPPCKFATEHSDAIADTGDG